MPVDISRAPFPITYRELWLPRGINGLTGPLPSSRYNGHEVTFTSARKGTTADGVHFNEAITSNINCGVIHNAAAKFWVSLRFKLDQDWTTGGGDLHLFGKYLDVDNFVGIFLLSATSHQLRC